MGSYLQLEGTTTSVAMEAGFRTPLDAKSLLPDCAKDLAAAREPTMADSIVKDFPIPISSEIMPPKLLSGVTCRFEPVIKCS
jgi:hypothetical protein